MAPDPESKNTSSGTIEVAGSGRAKCRACGTPIAKGELRFGERLPNPFGDGEATYWFHIECAAYRRAETFADAARALTEPLSNQIELLAIADAGIAYPRLTRIARLERAPSGRARCRACKEAIANESWRLALDIFQEGRFDPIGFIHIGCQVAYFGVRAEPTRVLRAGVALEAPELEDVRTLLSDAGPPAATSG
jgi:hypothetical protein